MQIKVTIFFFIFFIGSALRSADTKKPSPNRIEGWERVVDQITVEPQSLLRARLPMTKAIPRSHDRDTIIRHFEQNDSAQKTVVVPLAQKLKKKSDKKKDSGLFQSESDTSLPSSTITSVSYGAEKVARGAGNHLSAKIPPRSASEEQLGCKSKRKEKSWKKLFPPKDLEFQRRKQHYFDEFFRKRDRIGAFVNLEQRFKELEEKNINQLFAYLRNSAFKAEYTYFRHHLKSMLSEHLQALHEDEFAFLQNATEMDAAMKSKAWKPRDTQDAHDELKEISSQPEALSVQKAYLVFLHQHLLPMVQHVPVDVRDFFRSMAQSVAGAAESANGAASSSINGHNIATNCFMLYVLLPLLTDGHLDSIQISDKELQHYERNEMKFLKLDRLPHAYSDDETQLVLGVVHRMNSSIGPAPDRERALGRLLMRTFKSESEFLEADYRNFMGQFYLMFDDESSEFHHGLKLFKKVLQETLFGDGH